ncbi:MAG: hypothetical protein PHU49_00955 [Syntrophorhabdaceae bacterium]|nr:hypothetical protein [Syntrophorhabdaceae bacterium]MDD5242558.1 hypothetical protein [Syntrophorhabdaceae bacterium]
MTRQKKATVILILAGICLPLFLLFFVSDYDPRASLTWNLHHMEIVVRDQYWTRPSDLDETIDHVYLAVRRERAYLRFGGLILKPKMAIRYKYVVLFGIVCIVIGTGLIPTARYDGEHGNTIHHHHGTKA